MPWAPKHFTAYPWNPWTKLRSWLCLTWHSFVRPLDPWNCNNLTQRNSCEEKNCQSGSAKMTPSFHRQFNTNKIKQVAPWNTLKFQNRKADKNRYPRDAPWHPVRPVGQLSLLACVIHPMASSDALEHRLIALDKHSSCMMLIDVVCFGPKLRGQK